MSNIKSILISVFVLILLTVSVFFYKYKLIDNKSKETTKVSRDYVLESNNLPKMNEARQALKQKDFEGAYKLFKEAVQTTEDFNIKSTIEMSAAKTLMELDINKGAEYYLEISNNQNYPAVSRGFALLKIAQLYVGNRDENMLKLYLKNKLNIEKLSKEEIEYMLHTDIYNIYPYGISAATKGIYELRQSPATSTAKEVLEKYSSAIDNNIEKMRNFTGMKVLIPTTYMAKNSLYIELYKYGVVTDLQIVDLYGKADREAKIQNDKIAEQFNLLGYANYLASKGEIENSKLLLAKISNSDIMPMVTRNLSKEGSKLDYVFLFDLYKKDKEVKELFSQFNW